MNDYKYKVIPFIGQIKEKEKGGANKVAEQLQKLINQVAAQGWEFYRVDQVQIAVKPGCIAAVLGREIAYINFDQVIFRQQK